MPIYLDGKEYQDETALEAAFNPNLPESLKRVYIYTEGGEIKPPEDSGTDNNVISPDKFLRDKAIQSDPGNIINDQGDIVDYDFSKGKNLVPPMEPSRRPLERAPEAPDALKLEEGTSGAPDTKGLSVVGAVTDWWNRQKTYPGKIVDAVKGMANPSTDEDVKMLKGILKSAQEAFLHPGEVAQGKADPADVEKAFNMATTMVFGPAPVAKGMADGTLGSFVGVQSKTIDKSRLYKAQNMELEGYHPDEIWKATGTFKGPDGKWRQEIPDKDALLKEGAFDKTITAAKEGGKDWTTAGGAEASETWSVKAKGYLEPPNTGNLEDTLRYLFRMEDPKYQEFLKLNEVLDHPKLFEAYPQLKNFKVAELPDEVVQKGIMGQVSGDTLFLAPNLDPAYIRSVVMHEVQHFIQKIEGFARGGNHNEFKSPKLKAAEKQFDDVVDRTYKQLLADKELGLKKESLDYIVDIIKNSKLKPEEPAWANRMSEIKRSWHEKGFDEEFKQLVDIGEGRAVLAKEAGRHMELYRRLMGEVEARNVQTRMDMGEMDRFLQSPRATEDRPRFVQMGVDQDQFIRPAQLNSGGAGTQYNLLGYLFGGKEDSKPIDMSGTKETGFPTMADAENARKYDFGYGTGLEPYINNEVARIYKNVHKQADLDKVLKEYRANEDLTSPENETLRQRVGTFFAQSALAANRSAIASLGFDPSRMNLQVKQGETNIAGFFSPKEDQIWINALSRNTSTAVHESIHRGLEILRKNSEEAKALLKDLPEESLVRYMMYKTMGDPEKGKGDLADAQRSTAITLFDAKHRLSQENRDKIERLEAIAAEIYKDKRPLGPR